MESTSYTSFLCKNCQTEIQASSDLIGQPSECPACGAKFIVPGGTSDEVIRHEAGDLDPDSEQAMKSRTIRIDLGDF